MTLPEPRRARVLEEGPAGRSCRHKNNSYKQSYCPKCKTAGQKHPNCSLPSASCWFMPSPNPTGRQRGAARELGGGSMQGSASRAESKIVKGRERWHVIITISRDQESDEGMWTTYSSKS